MQYVTRYDGNYYVSNCPCAGQGLGMDCQCGEEQQDLDWTWDPDTASSDTNLQHNGKEAVFHPSYSSGTAAVRGTEPLNGGQYYWEIKMTTPVYGTDMMIGIGTKDAKLDHVRNKFTSLLGQDAESWGLSYQGNIHHNGNWERYARHRIGQGTVVGLHLDTWHGTLSYYLNGQPQGVAFEGLQGKNLYPAISSTAARSGMKVVATQFFPTSLQFLCCQKLRMSVRPDKHVLDTLPFPPGLACRLKQHLNWLLRPSGIPHPQHRLRERSLCQRVSCNNCLSQMPPYLAFSPASSLPSPVFTHVFHRPWELSICRAPLAMGEASSLSPQAGPSGGGDGEGGSSREEEGGSSPDLFASEVDVDFDPAVEYLNLPTASASAQPSTSKGLSTGGRAAEEEEEIRAAASISGTGSATSGESLDRDSASVLHGQGLLPETSMPSPSNVGFSTRKGKKRKSGASDSEEEEFELEEEEEKAQGEKERTNDSESGDEEGRDFRQKISAAKSKKPRLVVLPHCF